MATDNGFRLAVSNPCVELWILLHFRDSPGAQHRHPLQRMLKAYIAGYDKGLDFADLVGGIDEATARARRLDDDAAAMDEAGRTPTTGFYLLTESIARADA